MNDLHTIAAIERLKHVYFRALDTKNWPLMQQCLAADCVARYDGGKYSFDGRGQIIGFFRQYMDPATLITLHQAHHPEITLTGPDTATGIWYLFDTVIDLKAMTTLRGAGFYHDEYVRIDDQWQIRVTGYERTFEEIEARGEHIRLTHNRFAR